MLNMAEQNSGEFQQYSSVIDINNIHQVSRFLEKEEWLYFTSSSDIAASVYVYHGIVRGWAQFMRDTKIELEKFILGSHKHRTKVKNKKNPLENVQKTCINKVGITALVKSPKEPLVSCEKVSTVNCNTQSNKFNSGDAVVKKYFSKSEAKRPLLNPGTEKIVDKLTSNTAKSIDIYNKEMVISPSHNITLNSVEKGWSETDSIPCQNKQKRDKSGGLQSENNRNEEKAIKENYEKIKCIQSENNNAQKLMIIYPPVELRGNLESNGSENKVAFASRNCKNDSPLNCLKTCTTGYEKNSSEIKQKKCIHKVETTALVKCSKEPSVSCENANTANRDTHSNKVTRGDIRIKQYFSISEGNTTLLNPGLVTSDVGTEKIVGKLTSHTVNSIDIDNKEVEISPSHNVTLTSLKKSETKVMVVSNLSAGDNVPCQKKLKLVKPGGSQSENHPEKEEKSIKKNSEIIKHIQSEKLGTENNKAQNLMISYFPVELNNLESYGSENKVAFASRNCKNVSLLECLKTFTMGCEKNPLEIKQDKCIDKVETNALVKCSKDPSVSCDNAITDNSDTHSNKVNSGDIRIKKYFSKSKANSLLLDPGLGNEKVVGELTSHTVNSTDIDNKEVVISPFHNITLTSLKKEVKSETKAMIVSNLSAGDNVPRQKKLKRVKLGGLQSENHKKKKKSVRKDSVRIKHIQPEKPSTETNNSHKLMMSYSPVELRDSLKGNGSENKFTITNSQLLSSGNSAVDKFGNEINLAPVTSSVINTKKSLRYYKKKSLRYYKKKFRIKNCFVVLKRLKLTPELLSSLSILKFKSNHSFSHQSNLEMPLVKEKTKNFELNKKISTDKTTEMMNPCDYDSCVNDYSNNLLLEKKFNGNINFTHSRMDDSFSRKTCEIECKSLVLCTAESKCGSQKSIVRTNPPNNLKSNSNKLEKKDLSDYSKHLIKSVPSLNIVKRKKEKSDKCKENNNSLFSEQIQKNQSLCENMGILKYKSSKPCVSMKSDNISETIVKKSKTELCHKGSSCPHKHKKKETFKSTLNDTNSTKYHCNQATYSSISSTYKSYNFHQKIGVTDTKQSDKIHCGYFSFSLLKDLKTHVSSEKLLNKHISGTDSKVENKCINKNETITTMLEKTESNSDKLINHGNDNRNSEPHGLLVNKALTSDHPKDEFITDSHSVHNNNNASVQTATNMIKTDQWRGEKQGSSFRGFSFSTNVSVLENSISSEDEDRLKICVDDSYSEELNTSCSPQKLLSHKIVADQRGKANNQTNCNYNLDSRKRKYNHSPSSSEPVSKCKKNVLGQTSTDLKPVNFLKFMCSVCQETFTQRKDWIFHWEGASYDSICPRKKKELDIYTGTV